MSSFLVVRGDGWLPVRVFGRKKLLGKGDGLVNLDEYGGGEKLVGWKWKWKGLLGL